MILSKDLRENGIKVDESGTTRFSSLETFSELGGDTLFVSLLNCSVHSLTHPPSFLPPSLLLFLTHSLTHSLTVCHIILSQSKEIRVFVLDMYERQARRVLCEVTASSSKLRTRVCDVSVLAYASTALPYVHTYVCDCSCICICMYNTNPARGSSFFLSRKKGVVFGCSCLLCLVSLNELHNTNTDDRCQAQESV